MEVARQYARPYVYAAYLHQTNPKTIPISEYIELYNNVSKRRSILASGHDGLIIQNLDDCYYSVFTPEQVTVVSVSSLYTT